MYLDWFFFFFFGNRKLTLAHYTSVHNGVQSVLHTFKQCIHTASVMHQCLTQVEYL